MPPDMPTSAPLPPVWATLRRFLPYLWPADAPALRRRVVVAMLCVLAAKVISLAMPFAYKAAIDRMVPGMEPAASLAIALVAVYAGARFGSVLFDNLRNAVFEKVGQEAGRRLADDVFVHLHRLSLRFHLDRRTGAVTKIVERGTKSIDTMLYFLLFNIAPTVLELIAVCVIFFVKFGAWLVVVTLAMVALYIWFTRTVTEWRNQLRRDMVDMDTSAVAHAVDSLLNFETVKYFGAEEREANRYGTAMRRYAQAAVKSENSLAWLNIGQSLITNLMMAGAMAYTVWGWSRGQFTTGDVVLVNTLLAQLFRPLDLLGMVYRTIRQGLIDMEAMYRLMDTQQEIADVDGAPALIASGGEVRFDHVRFGYDPEREILHDVSFTVPAGRTLAIVGPSGAGKSTIARILFRFYDIQSGQVSIDGQDIASVTQASLRAAIGIVPQDMVLFNDTVGYNIGYGREGASQAEIEAAAKAASIHDFILGLPMGYDTRVGERGLKLSGGEKQRVAIARTLLKDPPVLVLDEATSALDSRTENEIQDVLRNIARKRTTLIVAHRLSTVVDADEIIVLDQGRIVERGRHADLVRADGLYAVMWNRQAAEREDMPVEPGIGDVFEVVRE
ncbi:MAG: ABC transporter ATP-binding protein/permease [Sphingobium sp.]|uniref:ABCB family ABC transporter ATP-binding protein/permease n=1 Tax=uncultured Sphingobium sp. TaxID=316087 RepID=UPI00120822FA|nr:ABC transporter ATP-binding protein/permease [uncultured Sphingobium sp.]MBU0657614.1 ABC transporter ATP-binding protein/permease [Alphaproteobacteria bacterium]TAJ75369.1 MAG: ABC transporter ATP-binding protein/permease [Sphingobium sp.]MBU1257155.1 ABC transporter ATP-binding protein/permease [Alphaproteobacteria bacterium]MBU1463680.1 ABC transporter ATP-binding protein/permease [Alphaproteobacteria bacterium]MBU1795956.1 ABC transporter ATP-binding protein/permease [Alphaproteobacteri